MKKKMLAGLVMGLALFMSGCGNMDVIDTVRTYNYAILELPDGRVIEGDVKQWKAYEGDVVQIQMMEGTIYYIHMDNVVLMQVK